MIIAIGGRLVVSVRDTPDVSRISCTIVVSGELGEQFDEAFSGLALTHECGNTSITGNLTDQSEFHGVLRQIFDLGLEILTISTHPSEVKPG